MEAGALGSSPSSAPKVHVTLGKSGPLLASVFLISKMVIITFALLFSHVGILQIKVSPRVRPNAIQMQPLIFSGIRQGVSK